jgi:hypothetical protein
MIGSLGIIANDSRALHRYRIYRKDGTIVTSSPIREDASRPARGCKSMSALNRWELFGAPVRSERMRRLSFHELRPNQVHEKSLIVALRDFRCHVAGTITNLVTFPKAVHVCHLGCPRGQHATHGGRFDALIGPFESWSNPLFPYLIFSVSSRSLPVVGRHGPAADSHSRFHVAFRSHLCVFRSSFAGKDRMQTSDIALLQKLR